jgi:endonuclease G, mitochondrial
MPRRALAAFALLLAVVPAPARGGEPPQGFTPVKGGLRAPSGLVIKQEKGHDVVTALSRHTLDLPGRKMHGVFGASPLKLIDEAWRKASTSDVGVNRWVSRRMHVVEVDMGRAIGFLGGRKGAALGNPETRHIKLILDPSGRLVDAYPHRSFLDRPRPGAGSTRPAVAPARKSPIGVVRALVQRGLGVAKAQRVAPHVVLGMPSEAGSSPNDYLLARDRYVISYNRDRKVLNWASWRLGAEDLGGASRQKDFRADPDLPAEWGPADDSDYSNSGWTRGHMVAAGEALSDVQSNSSTFLMTNIVPQAKNVNGGPWNRFENYYRDLVRYEGKEVHIMAGTIFKGPTRTIGRGVHIPSATWKVVVVLEKGQTLAHVNAKTRVIATIMPNTNDVSEHAKWGTFRTSVAEIEKQTGLRLFAHVQPQVADVLRHQLDRAPIPDGDHPMWLEQQRAASRAAAAAQ